MLTQCTLPQIETWVHSYQVKVLWNEEIFQSHSPLLLHNLPVSMLAPLCASLAHLLGWPWQEVSCSLTLIPERQQYNFPVHETAHSQEIISCY